MARLLSIGNLTALAALLVAAWFSRNAGYYGQELLAEIAILAIFAMSLDLLVGYAGMVSLGHAAFYGIGAYATAILVTQQGWGVVAAMGASIVAGCVAALLIGLIVVRLSGVFFIMTTLAIAQMFYAYFFRNREFGGDDGLPGVPRIDLEWLGLNTFDPADFAIFAVAMALLVYLLLALAMSAPFGRYLVALHQNENRMRALGAPVVRYKLAVFVLAGTVAGFAGSLKAQHTGFVSPDIMFWTVSGEVLIMVIVGGMGRLVGAVLGAAIVRLMSHELSSLTEFWMIWMGLFFIAVVILASDGLYGSLAKWWEERRRRRLHPVAEE